MTTATLIQAIPPAVIQAALSARDAAIRENEEARIENETAERQERARRAENVVAYARKHFGIELTANPENGTAEADGMEFRYVIREGYPDLLVEVTCPDCEETNWKEISQLSDLGDIINDGMKARSYRHGCQPKEEAKAKDTADPLATFKKLNKYAARAIDFIGNADDDQAAIVYALLAVADEIDTLRQSLQNNTPM